MRKILVLFAAALILLSGAVGCQQIVDQKLQQGEQRAKQELRQQRQKMERKVRQGLKKAQRDINKVGKLLYKGR